MPNQKCVVFRFKIDVWTWTDVWPILSNFTAAWLNPSCLFSVMPKKTEWVPASSPCDLVSQTWKRKEPESETKESTHTEVVNSLSCTENTSILEDARTQLKSLSQNISNLETAWTLRFGDFGNRAIYCFSLKMNGIQKWTAQYWHNNHHNDYLLVLEVPMLLNSWFVGFAR